MKVIGIAGLPGSGKSHLMDSYQTMGFSRYDDIHRNWHGNLPQIQAELHEGKKVAISDIVFCRASRRRQMEQILGGSIQWIFFENNPWQCAENCLYRFLFEKPHRPVLREIYKILTLAIQYKPYGEIVPVASAKKKQPHTLPEKNLQQ